MSGQIIGPIGVLPTAVPAVFAIDGTVHQNVSTQDNVVNLTTTSVNDYIIVCVTTNGGPVLTVSSTALGSFTFLGAGGGGSAPVQQFEIWAKFSSGTLSSDPITVHQTSAAFCTVDAFGVSGSGQTSLVWDAGGPQTGPTDPISITTINANTMVIAGYRESSGSSPTAGATFTQISGADFQLSEYKVLSTTQTLSCTQSTGIASGGVVIAIVHA